MLNNGQNLLSVSPIDGRYQKDTKDLSLYFSELALMRYRLIIEVEYFISLSYILQIKKVPQLSVREQAFLRSLYKNFNILDAEMIKEIEKTTNHDVKAIEYFFKDKIKGTPLFAYAEFIHFALTSEDVNNLAYSLMWKHGVEKVFLPVLHEVFDSISNFAKKHASQPMLALTHGQPATPTTVGKEFIVFAKRIERQIKQLENQKYLGKFGGATGTWAAHNITYPDVNWISFSSSFITRLGLEPNLYTIQIESHDSLAESFDIMRRVNTILIDFCRDVWMYISRGVLAQKRKEGEVGSSTMPHKINPISFENAEGNLGIANAYFSHLSEKLPISRMQRDLSDSTVLRNQGVALAHSLLACKNILKGMERIDINEYKLVEELDNHPEILAEAIQTVLRKVGYNNPYEKLKELTRGKEITLESIRKFINDLYIDEEHKKRLLELSPRTYIGMANKMV